MEPLEALIAYTFRDRALLEEALTHPSLAYETQRSQVDNQRLEYLGDAVLELILSEQLFRSFAEGSEGVLTKLRARLVSRAALAKCARRIHLGDYLRMGRGEEGSGGRERDSTLADAFEALTAAVYLDGGLEAARRLVEGLSRDALEQLRAEPSEQNPKGQLQEILQARGPGSLRYVVLREEGPDHRKSFVAGVEWNGQSLGEGGGGSKKEAEAAAAAAALGGLVLAEWGSLTVCAKPGEERGMPGGEPSQE
jgi:ribonuclease-3